MSSASLFVSHTLMPQAQELFRSRRFELNRHLPDVALKWRHLGKAGIKVVEAHEYTAALKPPESMLARNAPEDVATCLNMSRSPRRERVVGTVIGPAFMDLASESQIGFLVEVAPFQDSRNEFTNEINTLNEINYPWGDLEEAFVPLGSLATGEATDRVLEAFASGAPQTLPFFGAVAHPTPSR